MNYVDPLISRGRLAMIENGVLRSDLRYLRVERWHARELLHVRLLESASQRVEARSVREEMIYRRTIRHVSAPSRSTFSDAS